MLKNGEIYLVFHSIACTFISQTSFKVYPWLSDWLSDWYNWLTKNNGSGRVTGWVSEWLMGKHVHGGAALLKLPNSYSIVTT